MSLNNKSVIFELCVDEREVRSFLRVILPTQSDESSNFNVCFLWYLRPCVFIQDKVLGQLKVIVKWNLVVEEFPHYYSKTVDVHLLCHFCYSWLLQYFWRRPYCSNLVIVEEVRVLEEGLNLQVSKVYLNPIVLVKVYKHIMRSEMTVDYWNP